MKRSVAVVIVVAVVAALGLLACFGPTIARKVHPTPEAKQVAPVDASAPAPVTADEEEPDSGDEIDPERAARLKVHPSGPAIPFTQRAVFSEDALSRGVRPTTRARCERSGTAVWIPTKGTLGDCIRYWAAGFGEAPTPRAIVFFHGDSWIGAGVTGDMAHNADYLTMSEEKLQSLADDWHKRLKFPYIFVGRPGTHGSSGDHMQRRRVGESKTLSRALDLLEQRYGIKELVVVGQSGGGHVTSSLITERSDIICAVPTSAPSSPRIRWELDGRHSDATGFKDSYEPGEHVSKSLANPQLRVFVLGNPADKRVAWASQTPFADRLKEAGIPVRVLVGDGIGPYHHGLSNSGRIVAGWCAHGLSDDEILARAAKGLKS